MYCTPEKGILVPPSSSFLEGNCYLCVENVMRVLDQFVLHNTSWWKSTLHEVDS